ncbi:MAG: hypothetical protein H0T62_09910 [Parachlamydiaceae bacterium]|nr:hypothetical protein [Parachlamydiaceae bacterium]
MKRRSSLSPQQDIPGKANRVLNIFLFAFLLMILRVWHLTVVQHDEREENALRPQRRTVIEPAKRGTIRDRFNLPLAVNRIQYNATLLYSPLRQIPSARWEKLEDGTKKKRYMRKEYISKLAKLYAEKLSLDPERIEDLIHAKGALYNQIPFVIKEDITEKEYYSLRMLEKDWPGIHMQRLPRRYYPKGKVASDLLGYLGAINRNEYEKIIEEMAALQSYIAAMELDEELALPDGFTDIQQIRSRLKELKAKSYSLTDRVGKAGVEARFERDLRGSSGKKSYRSDARGNLLQELPGGNQPLSGNRLLLTISAELQEYAEELLIQNETIRETRVTRPGVTRNRFIASKKPWIKGGAIVVLEPQTGEILALASHPRYDPNDFILSGDLQVNRKKYSNIMRWLENDVHIGEIWDRKQPLEREFYNPKHHNIQEEQQWFSWEYYLHTLLGPNSPLLPILNEIEVEQACNIICYGNILLESLSPKDRELCIDICRVAIEETRFDENLLHEVGKQKIHSYLALSADFVKLQEALYGMTRELFHDLHFTKWRKENEKFFLSRKRLQEKNDKRYAKPYIDLLDAEETRQFNIFWDKQRWGFLEQFLCCQNSVDIEVEFQAYYDWLQIWHHEIEKGAHSQLAWHSSYITLKTALFSISPSERISYLKTFRSYNDLTRPLLAKISLLRNYREIQTEKDLAAAFYPRYGYGYGRSQAYRQSTPQGSIFKLVTAYEALIQKYHTLKDGLAATHFNLNPLQITDKGYAIGKETFVGYTEDGKPIPRFYKGGRIPRSLSNHLGKMGILEAIETSSNPYFSLLAGDVLKSPTDLADAARLFAYGERTGIDLPGEIAGSVPTDLETNRTGLYAMAIGQHSLVVTPLQASIALAAIANGGKVLKPKIVKAIMSYAPSFQGDNSNAAYNPISLFKPKTIERRSIDMPQIVQKILLEGMRRVLVRSQNESLFALSRLYRHHPEAISDWVDLKDQIIGKTSTAEAIERVDLDPKEGLNMYNHVWFGGISYSKRNNRMIFVAKDEFGTPEVVVVVYLRFGGFGKEGAPLAAQLVAKWREIKKRMEGTKKPFSSTL